MTGASASTLDSIKKSLVGLRMPRALEVLDAAVRRIEQGEIGGLEALDQLLIEELIPAALIPDSSEGGIPFGPIM